MKRKTTVVLSLLFICVATAASQTQQTSLNSSPSRAVGQPQLFPESGNPNRVEGREFWAPQNLALDTTVTPTAIYVSDLHNNRVLGWKNALSFQNGAHADIVVGQPDFFSTNPQGPGGTFATGLSAPTGIAVDAKGNLYVADSANNRVLRYPKPFSQQGQITPDLWIGQPSLYSKVANYTGQVSANGLELSSGNTLFQSGIAFDSSGNLWITDPGNGRVLEYSAGSIGCTNCTAAANIVIGQPTMSTTQPPLTNNQANFLVKSQFGIVDNLAFDPSGRLYVADVVAGSQGRVLVFSNPSSQQANLSADRIMGVTPQAELAAFTTQAALDTFRGETLLASPASVFFLTDNSVGVVDTALNRITIFPPYEQWAPESTHFSPQASPTTLLGQASIVLTNSNPNAFANGGDFVTPPPTSSTLFNPTHALFLAATKELFVADSGNNRVIVFPQSGSGFAPATRVLGQDRMNQFSANLVEGKEFNFFSSSAYADAALALDTTGPTPHLWVSDPRNNRVLGFKDARQLSPSSVADIVIGQPDLATAICNYPTGDLNQPTQSNLCEPVGLAVDSKGNLYVADSGNGRVLRFPNPWTSGSSAMETADLVLGQSSFTLSLHQPGRATMGQPYGIAFSGANGLLVSDIQYNRVVFIPFSANATFAALTDNGKAASKVFGQPDFTSIGNGASANQMYAPRLISTDTNGQLYVADSGNNRLLIFGDPNNQQTLSANATAILTLPGLNAPRGVYVNTGSGEIWVANTGSGTLVRYPKYDTLLFNPAPTATIPDAIGNTLLPTIAVAQDQYGDLFVADSFNRVAVFYQGFSAVNAASALVRPLAPGMMATLYPSASATQFGSTTATATTSTWPTSMGDIQVTFNGAPTPLYYISPGQINFYVPQNAQPGTNAEVEVVQLSTGQVLGAQQVAVNSVAPGLYTSCQANQTGSMREVCVLNEDNTVNTASNPAARGSVIQIFGTGQGLVSNPPADGAPAPGAPPLSQSLATARVGMGSCWIDDCGSAQPGDVGTSGSHSGQWVSYSGLAPNFVGLWQINAQIPMAIPPPTLGNGGQTILFVQVNGVSSIDLTSGFRTFFYVK